MELSRSVAYCCALQCGAVQCNNALFIPEGHGGGGGGGGGEGGHRGQEIRGSVKCLKKGHSVKGSR